MPPCGIFMLLQHNIAMGFLNYLEALGLEIVVCLYLLSLENISLTCSTVLYGIAK